MNKTRIQLDLSEQLINLLDKLVVDTDATSRAEVIRRALQIYARIIQENGSGNRLELVDPSRRNRKEILIP